MAALTTALNGARDSAAPRLGVRHCPARRRREVSERVSTMLLHPFDTGCLPLSCSGNPGVNGVFYRGANRTYFINSASGESTYAAPADCGHCL
jgi:hypothetical protein